VLVVLARVVVVEEGDVVLPERKRLGTSKRGKLPVVAAGNGKIPDRRGLFEKCQGWFRPRNKRGHFSRVGIGGHAMVLELRPFLFFLVVVRHPATHFC
jgi:hypothetical protein